MREDERDEIQARLTKAKGAEHRLRHWEKVRNLLLADNGAIVVELARPGYSSSCKFAAEGEDKSTLLSIAERNIKQAQRDFDDA